MIIPLHQHHRPNDDIHHNRLPLCLKEQVLILKTKVDTSVTVDENYITEYLEKINFFIE